MSFRTAQTFTLPGARTTSRAEVLAFRRGTHGTGWCQVVTTYGLYPNGTVLATGSFTTTPGSTPAWQTCQFSAPVALSGGVQYALVVGWTGGNGNHALYWRSDATSPTYTGGHALRSRSSGAWDATTAHLGHDHMFRLW
jgi:hypothetical protein